MEAWRHQSIGIWSSQQGEQRAETIEISTTAFWPPCDPLFLVFVLQVALLFSHVFWDDDLDYFGQVIEDRSLRGEFYLFWNLHRCMGKPVLVTLMAGKAAYQSETLDKQEIVNRVMAVLRKACIRHDDDDDRTFVMSLSIIIIICCCCCCCFACFQRFGNVADPQNAIVTRWASDRFACLLVFSLTCLFCNSCCPPHRSNSVASTRSFVMISECDCCLDVIHFHDAIRSPLK